VVKRAVASWWRSTFCHGTLGGVEIIWEADRRVRELEKETIRKSREQEIGSRALRKWLDEDVAYIITNEERAAYKALKTDEEREQLSSSSGSGATHRPTR